MWVTDAVLKDVYDQKHGPLHCKYLSAPTYYICRFQKGCTSSDLSAIHVEVYRVASRVMAQHRQVEAWR